MALHGLRIGKRGATLAPGGAVYVSGANRGIVEIALSN
jgi:hypothetical protein